MVSRMGPIVRGIEEEASKVIEWSHASKGFHPYKLIVFT